MAMSGFYGNEGVLEVVCFSSIVGVLWCHPSRFCVLSAL